MKTIKEIRKYSIKINSTEEYNDVRDFLATKGENVYHSNGWNEGWEGFAFNDIHWTLHHSNHFTWIKQTTLSFNEFKALFEEEVLIDRYLKVVNDKVIQHYPCHNGDYLKFVCYIDGVEYWGGYTNKGEKTKKQEEPRYFGTNAHKSNYFELMPVGFTPNKVKECLVGRYVEALVDYPHGGNVLKGEIGIIVEDKHDNCYADFPSQKDYACSDCKNANSSRYKILPKDYKPNPIKEKDQNLIEWLIETKAMNLSLKELGKLINGECDYLSVYKQLEGNDSQEKAKILYDQWQLDKQPSMEEIQAECKRRFPIGSKVRNTSGSIYIVTDDNTVYTINNNDIWGSESYGCLYDGDCNQYAELISLPESKVTEFKQGDYIVTLEGNFNTDCGKENYCFKQRIDHDSINPVYDLKGHRSNGNSAMNFNKKDLLLNWRYATKEEIAEYDRLGKPYDVTTLNKKQYPITPQDSFAPTMSGYTDEELLKEAKRRYPIGTKYKSANKQNIHSIKSFDELQDSIYCKEAGWIRTSEQAIGYNMQGWLYYKGRWAEIVETPVELQDKNQYIPGHRVRESWMTESLAELLSTRQICIDDMSFNFLSKTSNKNQTKIKSIESEVKINVKHKTKIKI